MPGAFTEAQFEELRTSRAVKSTLERVLGCSEEESLDILLDSIPMRRVLDDVSPSNPFRTGATANDLLYEMRAQRDEIRRNWGFNQNEWGEFLESKRWIRENAALRLRQEAERRDWP